MAVDMAKRTLLIGVSMAVLGLVLGLFIATAGTGGADRLFAMWGALDVANPRATEHVGPAPRMARAQPNTVEGVVMQIEGSRKRLYSPPTGKRRILVRGDAWWTDRYRLYRDLGEDLGLRLVLDRFHNAQVRLSRDMVGIICIAVGSDDKCITADDYKLLHPHVRVGRIRGVAPGVTYGKDAFCRTLMDALAGFSPANATATDAAVYDASHDVDPTAFVFPCFVLPADRARLLRAVARRMYPDNQPWIVKPTDLSGGRGIFVANSIYEVPLNGSRGAVAGVNGTAPERTMWVTQPFLDPPYLIEGYKFDMRVYVIVTSITPLRIYVHDCGLVRFAAEPYAFRNDTGSNSTAGGRPTQFLTNTSVNKALKDMIDLLWSFERLKEHVTSEGHDAEALFARIRSAIVRTFLAAEAALHFQRLNGVRPDNSRSYAVFGVDVILDASLAPRVIEVNAKPSMDRDAPDGSWYVKAKEALARDTLRAVHGDGDCGVALSRRLAALGAVLEDGAQENRDAVCAARSRDNWRCISRDDLAVLYEASCERERCKATAEMGRCLMTAAYPSEDGDKYAEWLRHLAVGRGFPDMRLSRSSWRLHRIQTELRKMEAAEMVEEGRGFGFQ